MTFRLLGLSAFANFSLVSTVNALDFNRFEQVTPNIYRSSRPENGDLAEAVRRDGIRTDVDLENKRKAVSKEQDEAVRLGIQFINHPLDASETPGDADVNAALAEMQDSKNFPVLVHCHHGEDRTGLIVGLYRVEVQHWTPDQAYQEMLAHGFHASLRSLDNYFRQRTGYSSRR